MSDSTPPVIYGSYSSLYRSIPADLTAKLEKACYFGSTGTHNFLQASQIFEAFDEPTRYLPAVALEYGFMLLVQGRFDAAREFLARAWEQVDEGRRQQPEYRLLRMLLARAEIWSRGLFERARDCMDDTREWLKEFPVEECTDIHVRIVREYALFGKISCNISAVYDPLHYGAIMTCNGQKLNPWEFIGVLRQHLQDSRRISDAYALLRAECTYLFYREAREKVGNLFLAACQDDTPGEPLWLREGFARLDMVGWVEGHDAKEANIAAASLLFESGMDSELPELRRGLELVVEKARIPTVNKEANLEQFEAWIALAEEAHEMRYFSLEDWGLSGACEAALRLYETAKTDENLQRFFSTTACYEALKREYGNAFYLANERSDVVSQLQKSDRGRLELLAWYDQFDNSYPDFELWNLCQMKLKTKYLTYQHLVIDELVLERIENEVQAVIEKEIIFWSKSSQGVKPDTSSYNFGFPNSSYTDLDTWSMSYDGKNPDIRVWMQPEGHGDRYVEVGKNTFEANLFWYKTLLEWLRGDAKKGFLKSDILMFILKPEVEPSNMDGIELLETLTPNELRDISLPAHDQNRMTRLTLEILEHWLFATPSYDEADRHFIIGRTQLDRIYTFNYDQQKPLEYYKTHTAAIEHFLELYRRFCKEVQGIFAGQVPIMNVLYGDSLVQESIKHGPNRTADTDALLDRAESAYLSAVEMHHATEDLKAISVIYIYLAGVESNRCVRDPQRSPERGLQFLQKSEEFLDEVRQDFTILGDIENLAHFSGVLSKYGFATNPYRRALGMLWTKSMHANIDHEWRDREMWTWIQKSKARSLSEFMGTGFRITENMIQRLKGSEECMVLLEEEKKLAAEVRKVNPANSRELRRKIRDVRTRMGKIAELKEIMDIRNGIPVTLEQVNQMAAASNGRVFFIDWIQHNRKLREGLTNSFTMTIVGTDLPPKAYSFDFDMKKFHRFILMLKDERSNAKLKNPKCVTQLQQFTAFVLPLLNHTQPGDTLVFSPTGMLLRIPLHAININDEPLLARNPIMYTASLYLLHRAYRSRTDLSPTPPPPPVIIGGVDCPPLSAAICESSISTVRSLLGGQTYTHCTATPSLLKSAIENGVSILHTLSHVTFEDSDPLNHSIHLPNDLAVAARDLFNIPQSPDRYPFHATLICCESGVIGQSDNEDEVMLGLVPALVAAGAASTVSTLWKVDQRDGVQFSEAFYAAFRESEGGVVDLARAVQTATLKLYEERGGAKTGIYHWAAFVGGGWWVLPWGGVEGGMDGLDKELKVAVEEEREETKSETGSSDESWELLGVDVRDGGVD